MNKLASKLFAVGAMALLFGALALPSISQAQQVPLGCVNPDLAAEATLPLDPALRTILCSERAECAALSCKDVAGENLIKCLKAANGEPGVVRRCEAAALAALVNCQFTGARADAACFINPNGGTTLGAQK